MIHDPDDEIENHCEICECLIPSGRRFCSLCHRKAVGVLQLPKKLGFDLDAICIRISSGLKWCYKCQDWRDIGEFCKNKSKRDGLNQACFLHKTKRIRKTTRKAYEFKKHEEKFLEYVEKFGSIKRASPFFGINEKTVYARMKKDKAFKLKCFERVIAYFKPIKRYEWIGEMIWRRSKCDEVIYNKLMKGITA